MPHTSCMDKISLPYSSNISLSRAVQMEKRQKFVELAEARVNRAIKDIRLIGNLSNRSAYDFSEDDVRKMAFQTT